MGLEFALVHDASKEAFELGKWCGDPEWRERSPATRDEVSAYFQSFFVTGDDQDQPELVEPVTDAVWAFIVSHPGCRLVDEQACYWTAIPEEHPAWDQDPNEPVYRKVGSRYDARKFEPGHRVVVLDGLSSGMTGTIVGPGSLSEGGVPTWSVDVDGHRRRTIREDWLKPRSSPQSGEEPK